MIEQTPFGWLLHALNAAPPYAMVAVLNDELRKHIGIEELTLLVADYAERTLEPVSGPSDSAGESSPIEDSDAGRAFRSQTPVIVETSTGLHVYVPVTSRNERLGVLAVRVADPPGDALVEALRDVALLLSLAFVAGRRYTDRFERVRRRDTMVLAAEIQWENLPVLTYATAQFSVASWLEPAYEIGGDCFDYSDDHNGLDLALLDAMGHGVRAALLSTLAISAVRNGRRQSQDVVTQVSAANESLHDQFGGEQFVTALVMRIDLASSAATITNAGHPPPRMVRAGRIEPVSLRADMPIGMFPGTVYRPQHLMLEPGDRMVLVSDGVLEASPGGPLEEFGDDRLDELLIATRDEPLDFAVREVTRHVMRHRGTSLRDDATVLGLDWRSV